MEELVDAENIKVADAHRAGSTPAPGAANGGLKRKLNGRLLTAGIDGDFKK